MQPLSLFSSFSVIVFLSSHIIIPSDLKQCKNSNHKKHVANFVKEYPTAKRRVPQRIIMVDPKDWGIALENPELKTTECCQVCSIAEDIAQAERGIGVTGLGQVCACQWKDRV
jgi:hypothetical protein